MGLQFGEHGLPFLGPGDWKNGVNLAGICGKGDSVWLGFPFKRAYAVYVGRASAR